MLKKIKNKGFTIVKDLFYEVTLLGGAHLIYQFIAHLS